MIDIEILIQTTLVTLLASILQAAVGYGFGLVAVPLLLIVNPAFIPAPLIVASLFLMLHVAIQNRFELSGHNIRPLLMGLLIGAPVGTYVLGLFNHATFGYLVAAIIFFGLIVSLLGLTLPVNPLSQFVSGLFSNIFGTSTGLGGAPIALLYQHESGAKIRLVLSTSFFVGSVFSLFSLGVAGYLSKDTLFLAAYMLPGIFFGAILGKRVAPYLDKGFSRIAILFITALSLAYLIGSTL